MAVSFAAELKASSDDKTDQNMVGLHTTRIVAARLLSNLFGYAIGVYVRGRIWSFFLTTDRTRGKDGLFSACLIARFDVSVDEQSVALFSFLHRLYSFNNTVNALSSRPLLLGDLYRYRWLLGLPIDNDKDMADLCQDYLHSLGLEATSILHPGKCAVSVSVGQKQVYKMYRPECAHQALREIELSQRLAGVQGFIRLTVAQQPIERPLSLVSRKFSSSLHTFIPKTLDDVLEVGMRVSQALVGLHALDNPGYAHRDVRFSNIFVDINSQGELVRVMLADLGNACTPGEFQRSLKAYEVPDAPRDPKKAKQLGLPWMQSADVYALGVVLLGLLDACHNEREPGVLEAAEEPVFLEMISDLRHAQSYEKILKLQPFEAWGTARGSKFLFSKSLYQLLHDMLHPQAKLRLNAEHVNKAIQALSKRGDQHKRAPEISAENLKDSDKGDPSKRHRAMADPAL